MRYLLLNRFSAGPDDPLPSSLALKVVIAGRDPAIQPIGTAIDGMDARVKHGHDVLAIECIRAKKKRRRERLRLSSVPIEREPKMPVPGLIRDGKRFSDQSRVQM
jgi:hypothetical protein